MSAAQPPFRARTESGHSSPKPTVFGMSIVRTGNAKEEKQSEQELRGVAKRRHGTALRQWRDREEVSTKQYQILRKLLLQSTTLGQRSVAVRKVRFLCLASHCLVCSGVALACKMRLGLGDCPVHHNSPRRLFARPGRLEALLVVPAEGHPQTSEAVAGESQQSVARQLWGPPPTREQVERFFANSEEEVWCMILATSYEQVQNNGGASNNSHPPSAGAAELQR